MHVCCLCQAFQLILKESGAYILMFGIHCFIHRFMLHLLCLLKGKILSNFTLCLPCCIGEKRRIGGSLQANLGKPNFHLKQTWFVVAVVSGDKKAGNEKKVVECFCCCCYFLFTIHFFKKMFQLYNYLTVYFNKWIKTAKRLKAIIYWDWMNWMSLFLT